MKKVVVSNQVVEKLVQDKSDEDSVILEAASPSSRQISFGDHEEHQYDDEAANIEPPPLKNTSILRKSSYGAKQQSPEVVQRSATPPMAMKARQTGPPKVQKSTLAPLKKKKNKAKSGKGAQLDSWYVGLDNLCRQFV